MDLPGLLLLLAIGLVLGWLLLVVQTAWMLSFPPRRSYAWAVARSLPGDPSELRLPSMPLNGRLVWSEWKFRHDALELPVWDVTGLKPDGPVMILTHGWSDSRVVMLGSGRVAALLPHVSRLLLWDLPGHGDAPRGTRCDLGHRESACLLSLASTVAEPDRPLVLYGFSLGARASVLAASARDVPTLAGVIAEAPYLRDITPAQNVLRLRALPHRTNLPIALRLLRWLSSGPRSAGPLSAAGLRCPLLVVHGDRDAICPLSDGRELAASIPAGEFVAIAGASHPGPWLDPASAGPASVAVASFLARLGAAQPECSSAADSTPPASKA